ncbi:RecQ family ATP-dependent DNA helicase [Liquorilactobacillus capillatus]|uniref:ATP-dependent DNA helicase RecQ n=1 Tax=Liquorilactobacillus capillatus DSM 19910 TaxID=1423731 RepID=A0A0R1LZW3_9LACO|nr:RecQ family ATP-dependent DNA helicase [Liquorilactobacillus capillatus]KRL01229.1 ATP-dependent DNA helicase [Liquorilactobacillus capillatus DSM 19910]
MQPTDEQLKKALKHYFNFTTFREGQEKIIRKLLAGESTMAILPTGTGKSLCYQLVGKLLQKPVVIISPLISLMQDQVEQLQFIGEKRVIALTSALSGRYKKQAVANLARFDFIYLAPEMLNKKEVIQALLNLDLGLLVVDEAHCISKWGPDFRPDYLGLGNLRKQLRDPVTLALTATATDEVAADICRSLFGTKKVTVIRYSVDRPNIFLAVEKISDQKEKKQRLISLVNQLRTPGLIYFSSKKKADEIADLLRQKTMLRVNSYHAGLSSSDRYAIQQQFMQGELDVVCATSAFGMGINKKNIRYIIHYHLPADLESYLQEIGRAGRDGKQSIAILLYHQNDANLQRHLMNATLPDNDLIQYYMDNAQRLTGHVGEQGELLDYYRKQGLSSTAIKELFTRRRQSKNRNLSEILAYINTSGCRRRYIREYFGEKDTQQHNSHCCQLLGEKLPLEFLWMIRDTEEDSPEPAKNNYRRIIEKLFNL